MPVVEVAAGVILRGDTVLVCQRAPTGTHPLQWEFPGGKRQPGETLRECARRELREELDVDTDIGVELWRTRHHYQPYRSVDLFFFLVKAVQGDIVNRVFAAVRWVHHNELHLLDFLDADRSLIDLLRSPSV